MVIDGLAETVTDNWIPRLKIRLQFHSTNSLLDQLQLIFDNLKLMVYEI